MSHCVQVETLSGVTQGFVVECHQTSVGELLEEIRERLKYESVANVRVRHNDILLTPYFYGSVPLLSVGIKADAILYEEEGDPIVPEYQQFLRNDFAQVGNANRCQLPGYKRLKKELDAFHKNLLDNPLIEHLQFDQPYGEAKSLLAERLPLESASCIMEYLGVVASSDHDPYNLTAIIKAPRGSPYFPKRFVMRVEIPASYPFRGPRLSIDWGASQGFLWHPFIGLPAHFTQLQGLRNHLSRERLEGEEDDVVANEANSDSDAPEPSVIEQEAAHAPGESYHELRRYQRLPEWQILGTVWHPALNVVQLLNRTSSHFFLLPDLILELESKNDHQEEEAPAMWRNKSVHNGKAFSEISDDPKSFIKSCREHAQLPPLTEEELVHRIASWKQSAEMIPRPFWDKIVLNAPPVPPMQLP